MRSINRMRVSSHERIDAIAGRVSIHTRTKGVSLSPACESFMPHVVEARELRTVATPRRELLHLRVIAPKTMLRVAGCGSSVRPQEASGRRRWASARRRHRLQMTRARRGSVSSGRERVRARPPPHAPESHRDHGGRVSSSGRGRARRSRWAACSLQTAGAAVAR